MDAITPEDVQRVLAKLIELALQGDVSAAKEFLDRAVGKSRPPEDDQQVTAKITLRIAPPKVIGEAATAEIIDTTFRANGEE